MFQMSVDHLRKIESKQQKQKCRRDKVIEEIRKGSSAIRSDYSEAASLSRSSSLLFLGL
jgi:hypothetical protein